ncbi:PREDICTED: fructose-2,6-bisphosphatase TIGAR isoform X1 [Rhinopithecus bieti]|uniref:fructose-2,6-bisphosphatase TIGAR isoform X1 n=1 Tax=Rhinopithecus bieti TaxID=61621 RepID=UPI00083BF280|nr:PREDICTED: fructose-2,6-bisphosphatase TIGAR isoform X1 [Rhinopithecus bieti]
MTCEAAWAYGGGAGRLLGGSGVGEVARSAGAARSGAGPLTGCSSGNMARFALTVVRQRFGGECCFRCRPGFSFRRWHALYSCISCCGETRFNKEKIIQGQGVDVPLSETGFRQAAAAGIFLNNVKFTHAFSSDLMRTKQTMHGILEKSKVCKDMTVKYDSRLRERKYGVVEGKALSEMRAMAKAAREECPVFTPPGGETLDQVKMRGIDFFEFLCQLILKEADQKEQFSQGSPGNCLETSLAEIFPLGKNRSSEVNSDSGVPGLAASVLVVSHGAYMRSLFDYFLTDLKCSLPATLRRSEVMSVTPNTGMSLFIINFEEGREVKPTVQCICMNLQDHLNGLTETR